MLNVSNEYQQNSRKSLRELSYIVRMSFDKVYDPSITFFTIGTSTIGGGDIIKGDGDVVQEWEKYVYTDYSDRVIDIEWTSEMEPYASVTQQIASITFDNHDDFFTPNKGSSIDSYILPYRPIRIYAGFENEVTSVFIGLTKGMPKINEAKKTARFEAIDFLELVFNKELNEGALVLDGTSTTVLTALFELGGLTASQLDFDDSFTTIPFAYFKKGERIRNLVKKLMEAEMGRLYLNGDGVIRFKNRQNYSNTIVETFTPYINIIDYDVSSEDAIINEVEIKGKRRAVQPSQKYFELQKPVYIKAGQTLDVWAEFSDPVVSVTAPVYITNAVTSYYEVNTAENGGGTASTDVNLTTTSEFSTSYKMTFENTGATNLYITDIVLWVEPAIVIESIYVLEKDATSIEKYNERSITIDNDFFQDDSTAQSRAITILNDLAEFGAIVEVNVKGSPAFEVDDLVQVNLYNVIKNFRIQKIENRIGYPAKFTQRLTLREFDPVTYFTIGTSLIGGTDEIAP